MKQFFQTFKLNNLKLALGLFVLSVNQSAHAQMSLQLADTLEQTLVNFANNTNMQGVASAVIFPDGSTWSTTRGYNDNLVLDTNMLFDIGSNTKSMVSAVILMLEEDGLLSIDDTLYNYINVVENVPYGITIKQLLEQRSGIANYTNHPYFVDSVLFNNQSTFWHPDSILSNFLEVPLFTAGQYWSYSNTNYLLLGKVIEAVEGQSLNTVLNSRLFSPFDLNNSYLDTYDSYSEVRTGAYFGANNFWNPNSFYGFMSSSWAAGGVIMTPNDFVSYCHQLFRGDMLSPNAFTKMEAGTNFGGGNIYGKGIEKILYNGRPYFMHGGNTLQNSEMHYSIDNDFSVTVMNLDKGFYSETKNLQNALIDVIEFAIDNSLSVTENRLTTFKSYPNPSSHQIYIELPSEVEIIGENMSLEVYNLLGEMVYNTQFKENQLVLKKSDIGEGIYILKIVNDHRVLGNDRIVFN